MAFNLDEWRKKDKKEWESGFIPPLLSEGQVSGRLEGFAETGTEGFIWTVEEQGKGYKGIHYLKNGDRLEIFDVSGDLLYDLIIDLEYETGYMPYPENPEYGQQTCFGCWVHGCQRGWNLDDWGHLFLDNILIEEIRKYPSRLRGRLTKSSFGHYSCLEYWYD